MKKMMMVLAIISLVLIMPLGPDSLAQSKFPEKSIEMYNGFTAGGGTDTLARGLAAGAEKILGEKILVVNKPGGGGALAASLVAKMKPDGYAIMLNTDTPITRSPHLIQVAYDSMKDFTFISHLGVLHSGIVVQESSPFKTWKDVVKWAKAHPGELTFGTTGPGTTADISMALIARREGLTYRSTPFAGDAPTVAAVLGGHVMAAAATSGGYSKHVKAKELRALLVFEEGRTEGSTRVPTFKDLGYDIETPTGIVIFGPKGMPGEIVKKLNDAFAVGRQSDAYKTLATALELIEPQKPLTAEDVEKIIRRSHGLFKSYFEEIGLAKK